MLKKFTGKFIFTLLVLVCFCLPAPAQVFDLSSAGSAINLNKTEVYKPSRFLLGSETKFVVKGEPGSKVLLLFSENNNGAEPFGNLELHLGDVMDKIEGVTGEKGVAELVFSLPADEAKVGQILYFEAIVWKNDDFSDAIKAKIIEINGQETLNNALVVAPKHKEGAIPGFNAALPGIGNVGDTINAMRGEEDSSEELKQEMYYRQDSLMLRNLRAPEVKQYQRENAKEN